MAGKQYHLSLFSLVFSSVAKRLSSHFDHHCDSEDVWLLRVGG